MTERAVDIDRAQFTRVQAALRSIGAEMPRVIHTATRRATDKTRAEAVRAMHAELNVKVSKLYQAGSRDRPVKQRYIRGRGGIVGGRITISKGRIRLGRFQPNQHWKKGKTRGRVRTRVSYKIKRGGARQKIQDAFVLEFPSGYQGIFRRAGDDRLPLKELHGPSVPHVAEKSPRMRRLGDTGMEQIYTAEVDSRLEFVMARAAAA